MVFKNQKTGKVEQLQSSDVKSTKFMPRALGYCLKVVTNSGYVHKFDGFKESVSKAILAFINFCFTWY